MDMLAYMLGKQAGGGGGGGGGGDYARLIIPEGLVTQLLEPGWSWQDDQLVEFSMDWGEDMGGEFASFYGIPGHTITLSAKSYISSLVVLTLENYQNQVANFILFEENVQNGDTFTFTMPYDDVVFITN